MRVLVTGATGFLGTALVKQLHTLGIEVYAHGRNQNQLQLLASGGVKTCRSELTNKDATLIGQAPEQVDCVIHTAGLSSPWGPREDFIQANVAGTRTAIHFSQNLAASQFIFISSPTVYFQFTDQHNIPESVKLPPPINA